MGGDVFQAGSALKQRAGKAAAPQAQTMDNGWKEYREKRNPGQEGKTKQKTHENHTNSTHGGRWLCSASSHDEPNPYPEERAYSGRKCSREGACDVREQHWLLLQHPHSWVAPPRATPPRTFCLELAVKSTLALNLQRSIHICLLRAGITDVRHQIWPVSLL